MKSAGYRTYMTGKWHCKAAAEKSFDVVTDVRPGMPKATPEGYNRPIGPGQDTWSPSDPKFGGFWEGGTHWSEVVANHADDFLDAKRASEMNRSSCTWPSTHRTTRVNRQPNTSQKYPVESIEMPVNFLPIYPYADEIGCGKKSA